MTGQHGHRWAVIRATGGHPVVCPVVLTNGMGNGRTEDGTAWADVLAIQSLYSLYLGYVWYQYTGKVF